MKVRQHMTAMALAACIAAVAAPGTSAATGRSGGDALSRYVANHDTPTHFVTDTLAPGGGDAVSRYLANHSEPLSFVTDTLAPGGGGGVAISAREDGVSWLDLGVGFSAALLLVGLVLAARIVFQRRSVVAA
jgi:F0F1-type ATP synthase membrane subunit c/vacuolar-type H+-ATPase subunit K